MIFGITKVGKINGVSLYETRAFGKGQNSAALALPGVGIFLGDGVFSRNLDLDTLKHEFGHILQSRLTGMITFYLFIGLPSLLSAWLNWHKLGHNCYWTETWSNELAKQYFENDAWDLDRFPCKDISDRTKFWLYKWV